MCRDSSSSSSSSSSSRRRRRSSSSSSRRCRRRCLAIRRRRHRRRPSSSVWGVIVAAAVAACSTRAVVVYIGLCWRFTARYVEEDQDDVGCAAHSRQQRQECRHYQGTGDSMLFSLVSDILLHHVPLVFSWKDGSDSCLPFDSLTETGIAMKICDSLGNHGEVHSFQISGVLQHWT